MANISRTCSLSRQNCATLYPFPGSGVPYTTSSCALYTPWLSGDTGICGWVGAPCTEIGTGSNCNLRRAGPCIDGVCRAGLGDPCPSDIPEECNGALKCGSDRICGGEDAEVQLNATVIDIRQLCVTGRAINDTSGILRCTSATTSREITVIPVTATITQTTTTPAAQTSQVASPVPSRRARPRAAMFAGIFCGLAVILVIVILFLCRRSRRKTKPDLEPVQYTMVDRSSHDATPPIPDSANSKARRPRKADAGSGNIEQPPSTIIPLRSTTQDRSRKTDAGNRSIEQPSSTPSERIATSTGSNSADASENVASTNPTSASTSVVYVLAVPGNYGSDGQPPPYERP